MNRRSFLRALGASVLLPFASMADAAATAQDPVISVWKTCQSFSTTNLADGDRTIIGSGIAKDIDAAFRWIGREYTLEPGYTRKEFHFASTLGGNVEWRIFDQRATWKI